MSNEATISLNAETTKANDVYLRVTSHHPKAIPLIAEADALAEEAKAIWKKLKALQDEASKYDMLNAVPAINSLIKAGKLPPLTADQEVKMFHRYNGTCGDIGIVSKDNKRTKKAPKPSLDLSK